MTSEMTTERILIVDDEETLCEVLKLNLENEGYDVDTAFSAEDVATADIPIIFCTARDSEDDMVKGLNLGADDYITKPYTVRNVIARVKTVLRRTSGHKNAENPNRLAVGTLILDLDLKTCSVDGMEVKLTKKEFELLAFLIANKGKICSRDQILSNVWSEEVIVLDRTIDVNITRIRQKIGSYGTYIITRPGFGYGFKN